MCSPYTHLVLLFRSVNLPHFFPPHHALYFAGSPGRAADGNVRWALRLTAAAVGWIACSCEQAGGCKTAEPAAWHALTNSSTPASKEPPIRSSTFNNCDAPCRFDRLDEAGLISNSTVLAFHDTHLWPASALRFPELLDIALAALAWLCPGARRLLNLAPA